MKFKIVWLHPKTKRILVKSLSDSKVIYEGFPDHEVENEISIEVIRPSAGISSIDFEDGYTYSEDMVKYDFTYTGSQSNIHAYYGWVPVAPKVGDIIRIN